MFETAELGRKVPKKAFEKAVPELRVELVDLQQRLRTADFPVLVLFSGVDGAGKGETINLLNEWMDPRWIEILGLPQPPSDEEQERPRFWRYWRDLPAEGAARSLPQRLVLTALPRPRLRSQPMPSSTASSTACIAFERVLADDGALILKFWMHLGRLTEEAAAQGPREGPAAALAGASPRSTGSTGGCTTASWRWPSTRSARRRFARAPWKIVEGDGHQLSCADRRDDHPGRG